MLGQKLLNRIEYVFDLVAVQIESWRWFLIFIALQRCLRALECRIGSPISQIALSHPLTGMTPLATMRPWN